MIDNSKRAPSKYGPDAGNPDALRQDHYGMRNAVTVFDIRETVGPMDHEVFVREAE